MKKSKTSLHIAFFAILLLLFFNFTTQANKNNEDIPRNFRPGYIITLENDTVHGFIEYSTAKKSYLQCRFMKNPGDEVQNFSPRQINGYGFGLKRVFQTIAIDLNTLVKNLNFDIKKLEDSDEIVYLLEHFDYVLSVTESGIDPVLKTADGKPVTLQPLFMEVLVRGEISLYSLDYQLFVRKEEDQFYLLRQIEREVIQNDQLFIHTTNEYLRILSVLTQDCPEVRARLKNLVLSSGSIIRFIIAYNECVGSKYWIPKEKPPVISFNPGISLSSGYTSLSFKVNPYHPDAPDRVSETEFTIFPGLYADVVFPRTLNNFSLSLGAQFYNVEFSDYAFAHRTLITTETFDRTFLSQTYLKMPIEVHFKPFKNSFHPSLMAGVNLNFSMREDLRVIKTLRDKETHEIIASNTIILNNILPNNHAFVVGADIRKSLGERFYLMAGIRYEMASSFLNIDVDQERTIIVSSNDRMRSLSFQISILMNFTDFYK